MHAIICQENGSHYISMVFGYYSDRARSYYADYWIVWDSKKERLIKWPTFKPKKKFLEKQILIVFLCGQTERVLIWDSKITLKYSLVSAEPVPFIENK